MNRCFGHLHRSGCGQICGFPVANRGIACGQVGDRCAQGVHGLGKTPGHTWGQPSCGQLGRIAVFLARGEGKTTSPVQKSRRPRTARVRVRALDPSCRVRCASSRARSVLISGSPQARASRRWPHGDRRAVVRARSTVGSFCRSGVERPRRLGRKVRRPRSRGEVPARCRERTPRRRGRRARRRTRRIFCRGGLVATGGPDRKIRRIRPGGSVAAARPGSTPAAAIRTAARALRAPFGADVGGPTPGDLKQ